MRERSRPVRGAPAALLTLSLARFLFLPRNASNTKCLPLLHCCAFAENRVRMLETDGMRLQLYQDMLTNISTQATLLLGFALATFGADLLPYIMDARSQFCVYKSAMHQFVGALFLTANTCCCSFCLLVVIFSSFLITRSQEAYLHVGGNVAVFRTSRVIKMIYVWYASALLCPSPVKRATAG